MKNRLLTWVTALVVAIVMVMGGSSAVFADTGNEYIGVKTEAKVYEDFENDIWLQFQHKKIEVDDTVRLYPRRVPQIKQDDVSSNYSRPQFNFEIIQGDSVELSTSESTEDTIATGVKEGTSIIKVTYDESNYYGDTQGAISPVNTGYVAITVGENSDAEILSSISEWKHYDTIYYSEGKTVPYDITVTTKNAESIKVTCNGIEVEKESDGHYVLALENRANIIGIEAADASGNVASEYRILDARYIKVNVDNKTNPGQKPLAGDTLSVSFAGVTMPVYKIIRMYNPEYNDLQWGNISTRITYKNDILGEFEGACNQWDLATNNGFDITIENAGVYNFYSENGIYCSWWGSDLGADLDPTETLGYYDSKSWDNKGYFSSLPDFNITVYDKETDNTGNPEQSDFEKNDNQSGSNNKGAETETGDDFNMTAVIVIALAALAAAVVITVRKRRS